jgi:hypothetical protein
VGLEWGPLSLVSTIEELLGIKSSGSILEIRDYGHRNPSHWPRDTLCPQQLAVTSPTSSSHLFSIVCSRTQDMEFSLLLVSRYSKFLNIVIFSFSISFLLDCFAISLCVHQNYWEKLHC